MSSGVGIHGSPMLSVYSAAKGYLNILLTQLNAECRDFGARFVAACPLWVSTPMTMTNKINMQFISPARFVKCLFTSDLRHRTVVNPYWYHRLVVAMLGLLRERARGSMLYR